jgi:hypothetical protein
MRLEAVWVAPVRVLVLAWVGHTDQQRRYPVAVWFGLMGLLCWSFGSMTEILSAYPDALNWISASAHGCADLAKLIFRPPGIYRGSAWPVSVRYKPTEGLGNLVLSRSVRSPCWIVTATVVTEDILASHPERRQCRQSPHCDSRGRPPIFLFTWTGPPVGDRGYRHQPRSSQCW